MTRDSKTRNAFPKAKVLRSQRDDSGKEQYYVEFETVQKALLPGKTLVFLETLDTSENSKIWKLWKL